MGHLLARAAGAFTSALALVVLAAPVQAQRTRRDVAPISVNNSPIAPNDGYRIGADDTLEVVVFQASDLSRNVQVDSAGRILMPLIGSIDAMGLTPMELSARIAVRLSEKYMRDPQVTVLVKEAMSQRVTVDGAVVQPGVYPLAGPTTLLQAVALAKGMDPRRANTHHVSVFRMTDGARVAATYDLAAIRTGKAADPEVYPKDVIVVAGSAGASLMESMSGVLPFVSLLRPW
jgi:polysaccharide export outer membrane protein